MTSEINIVTVSKRRLCQASMPHPYDTYIVNEKGICIQYKQRYV